MLSAATISFLKSLKKNNNKPWFDEHRNAYEDAKKDMEQLVQKVIDAHSVNDASIADQVAKKCMFRINRDIRFAKDKTPYKTNIGASIIAGGKKSPGAGYYIHIEPGASFIGGGLYMPSPENLRNVRQEIDYNLPEFKGIVESKKFKSVFNGLSDDAELKLSRVPQGFDKDSEAAPYLVYKSFIAGKSLTDAELTEKNLTKNIVSSFSTLQPLLAFLNRNIEL